MSNSNQAWSLARVKWEKRTVLSANGQKLIDDAKIVNRSETAGSLVWDGAYIESISDSADNSRCSGMQLWLIR